MNIIGIFMARLSLYPLLSQHSWQAVITAPAVYCCGHDLSSEWKGIAGAGVTAGVFLRLAEIGL